MNKENPKLERVVEKPIKIFGKQLKIMRVVLIFLAASLYAGMMYVELNSIISLLFTIIFSASAIVSIVLINKKIMYFGKYNLECSAAGDLYFTQLQGICPKCNGFLKVSKKTIQCQKDQSHVWNLEKN